MSITNAALAQQVADLLTSWQSHFDEFSAWMTGEVGGGPYLNGTFPLTDLFGTTLYYKSPAQLEADVTGLVDSASTYATTAQGHATSAQAAQTAAEAARDLALSYRNAAQSARDLALSYRDDAANSAANALTHRNAASASATAAALSESNAAASESAAAASEAAAALSEANAAASAAAAATFNPALYYAKADGVPWADLTGVPSTFTPSAHTHAIADVTGLQTALDGKEPSLGNPATDGYVLASTAAGVRSWVAMGGGVTDHGALSGLTDDDHTQYYNAARLAAYTGFDARYYTETEVNSLLAGKQDTISLTANRAVITDGSGNLAVSLVTSTELGYLDGVTSSIQTQLNGKASTSHNHAGTYEPVLGNPAANGYVLSSTTGGTRSWVPMSATFVGAKATRTTTMNVANGSFTTVTLNNEKWDTDTMFTVNGSTISAPSDGYYLVQGSIRWDTNTNGQRITRIYANGVIVAEQHTSCSGGNNTTVACDAIVYLTSGQTVYMQAGNQNGGGTRVVTPSGDTTFLSLTKIG